MLAIVAGSTVHTGSRTTIPQTDQRHSRHPGLLHGELHKITKIDISIKQQVVAVKQGHEESNNSRG